VPRKIGVFLPEQKIKFSRDLSAAEVLGTDRGGVDEIRELHAARNRHCAFAPSPNSKFGWRVRILPRNCRLQDRSFENCSFFFCVGGGEGKERCWVRRVGVVCEYFSGDYCLCPIPDLTIGIQLWNMVFLCKKSAWEAMCFCFPPAGVIHSCFRNWVWFLDTF